jgi:hypothetical protein
MAGYESFSKLEGGAHRFKLSRGAIR